MTHPLIGPSCEGSDLLATDSYLAASDSFRSVAKGHITPIIDPDGAIRKVPAAICIDGQAFPALAIAPLLQLARDGSDWEASIRKESGLLSSSMTMNLGPFSSFTIPLDSSGNLRVSFHKSPDAFRSISAIDIVEGNFECIFLDNGVVLVGATALVLMILFRRHTAASPQELSFGQVLTSILDAEVHEPAVGRQSWRLFAFFGGFVHLCLRARASCALRFADFSGHNSSDFFDRTR